MERSRCRAGTRFFRRTSAATSAFPFRTMKPLRVPALLRATFAALAILLAGCDDGPTTPDSLDRKSVV